MVIGLDKTDSVSLSRAVNEIESAAAEGIGLNWLPHTGLERLVEASTTASKARPHISAFSPLLKSKKSAGPSQRQSQFIMQVGEIKDRRIGNIRPIGFV
jgi:hypothetical protein